MVSERPYGVALSIEEAISELERMAGSQFDPAIVSVLVEVLPGRAERAPAERHLTAL